MCGKGDPTKIDRGRVARIKEVCIELDGIAMRHDKWGG